MDHLFGADLMTEKQKGYYLEMAKNSRLIPLRINDKVKGIITFFIGSGYPDRYINRDPWEVVNDEPNGDTIYIDQLLTSKDEENPYYSLYVWKDIKNHFRQNYPYVKYIRWNRWRNERVVKNYREELR